MHNNSRLLDKGSLDATLSGSHTFNSFSPQNTFEIDKFSYYLLFMRHLRPREGKILAAGKW